MKQLTKGQYFGDKINVIQIDSLVLTETTFAGKDIDWHFHDNMHFSYSLYGNSYQTNKKEKHAISSGSLIYNNSENPHFNTKHSNYSKNFYIEIEDEWYEKMYLKNNLPKGEINLKNPDIKIAIDKIYSETKVNDTWSKIEIESILINVLGTLKGINEYNKYDKPKWTISVKELIHENSCTNFSLFEISKEIGIHPVHLSRQFKNYFGLSLGAYIRYTKIHKAASLLKDKEVPLIDICYLAGFYDQSHMSKNFKKVFKITPLQYRKLIS